MALPRNTITDDWIVKLFKLRGFGSVKVSYDNMADRNVVTLARHSDGQPVTVTLPDNHHSMALLDFRAWVDGAVEGVMGPTDFPTISFQGATGG